MLVLFILAALAYGGASLAYGLSSENESARAPRVALGAGALLHLATIGAQCTNGLHPFRSIFLVVSLTTLTTILGYLLVSARTRPMRALGATLAPVGLVGLTVGIVMGPSSPADLAASMPIVRLHVAAATLGLSGFALAAGVAGLYLGMERRLRAKIYRPRPGGPSLAGLDRLHLGIVLVVTPVFTVAIATGAVAALREGGSAMLQARTLELVAAGVAWLASVGVLAARGGWGIRGRRAAWLTIVAFAATVAIVVGYGVRG